MALVTAMQNKSFVNRPYRNSNHTQGILFNRTEILHEKIQRDLMTCDHNECQRPYLVAIVCRVKDIENEHNKQTKTHEKDEHNIIKFVACLNILYTVSDRE